ncbi:MAG: DUF6152 family protein [Acetobacterales bacterium]
MHRRDFLHGAVMAGAVAAVAALALPAAAHHGWAWATDEEFELTGRITAVRLGNPHGELTLDAAGESWTVEIGQPWRNRRVDLTESVLAPGTEVTAHGHRASDPSMRLMKAERLMIGGKDYDLYPDRGS